MIDDGEREVKQPAKLQRAESTIDGYASIARELERLSASWSSSTGWVALDTLTSQTFPRLQVLTGGSSSRAAVALTSCPSQLIELDGYGRRVRKVSLATRLLRHVAWRLAPAQWARDLSLQLAAERCDGWVPLKVLCDVDTTFGELQELAALSTEECVRLAAAAVGSERHGTLELSPDGGGVRVGGLPRRVRLQVEHFVGEGCTRELQEIACSSPGGYIPLASLAALPELSEVSRETRKQHHQSWGPSWSQHQHQSQSQHQHQHQHQLCASTGLSGQ